MLIDVPPYHFVNPIIKIEILRDCNMTTLNSDESNFDGRIKVLETKMGYIDQGINDLKKSFDNLANKLDSRFDKIDAKFDKVNELLWSNFKWLIGIMITLTIAGTASTIVAIVLGGH